MLPIECHTTCVIGDRKIRVSGSPFGNTNVLLIGVLDASGEELVGYDQLGLRPHQVAALGEVDEPFF